MGTYLLLYHALDLPSEPVRRGCAADRNIVVDGEQFRQQLACLGRLGLRVVPLEHATIAGMPPPDGDHVVLTFDDGHRSNWWLALPVLVEANVTATFYVVAGFVDKDSEYLTSAQLREMAAHKMLIGSHSMTHRWLPELDPRELRRELVDSRARLEDIVQRPVLDFALPGGHFNRRVMEAARECGYRSVATCKVGVYRTGDDPFRLPRLEIRRGLSPEGFRSTFQRSKLVQLQLLEAGKACLRSVCGLPTYGRLRRFAHRHFVLDR